MSSKKPVPSNAETDARLVKRDDEIANELIKLAEDDDANRAKFPRSSNSGPLTLLLQVHPGARITAAELQSLYDEIATRLGASLKQKAIIIDGHDADAVKRERSVYNILLSESPLGDFSTFIREADYVSYLKSYPGYTLPDASSAKKLVDLLTSRTGASTKEGSKQATTPKKTHDRRESILTAERLARASKKGVSGHADDPKKVGAGSATKVALALAWPNASSTVGRVTDGDLTWDSPAVFPAEWISRDPFSLDSKGTAAAAAAAAAPPPSSRRGRVFGSSEAYSLINRHKALWRRVFTTEASLYKSLRNAGSKTRLRDLRGVVTTSNTPVGSQHPIRSVALENGKPVWTEYTKDKADGAVKVRRVRADGSVDTSQDASAHLDPWSLRSSDAALENMAFSFECSLRLQGDASVVGSGAIPSARVYPFQRGFYTEIESELDFAILDHLMKRRLDRRQVKFSLDSSNHAVPHLVTLSDVAAMDGQPNLTMLNDLAIAMNNQMPQKLFTATPSAIVALEPPKLRPHAALWKSVVAGEPVSVGGVQVARAGVLTLASDTHLLKYDFDDGAIDDARKSGQLPAVRVLRPSDRTLPPGSMGLPSYAPINAPVESITTEAPPELTSTDDDDIPDGFTLTGEIKLFGLFDEQLYSTQGGSERQIVKIKPGTMKLSDFMPNLAAIDLGSVELEDIEFHYNEVSTDLYEQGTWLRADLLFSGLLQPIGDLFRSVFQQKQARLRIETLLGTENDWSKPIQPRSFALQGLIPGMQAKLGDVMTITELGFSLNSYKHLDQVPPYEEKTRWDSGFHGKLLLQTPQNMAPLQMDFSLRTEEGEASMSLLCADETENFFGITGLRLEEVALETSFDISSPASTFNFSMSGSILFKEHTFTLEGHYNGKDDWALKCEVAELTWADLLSLYEHLFGSELHVPDHDVLVEGLSLEVGSEGIVLHGKVTVEGHASAEATIKISGHGLEISGEVADVIISGDITLKKASLDVFVGKAKDTEKSGLGTSFRLAVSGEVEVAGATVSAAVYLDKTPEKGLEWTLFGKFKGALTIAKLEPALKGTFLDFTLKDVCIIASNAEKPDTTEIGIPDKYSVVKGVQLAATLTSIEILDEAMNNKGAPTSGITLQAIYDATSKNFELKVNLLVAQKVSMKNSTITSGDISLLIASNPPALTITAQFFVKVPGQEEPLEFDGSLKATFEGADLSVAMVTEYWYNPLGLSKAVKLGPNCALDVGIIYAGGVYPSKVGVSGGLWIGASGGKAALLISEAPNEELIMLEVDELGIRDLVNFAAYLLNQGPTSCEDFIHFKKVKLYLSTGVTIGTITYPAGASFSCDAIIFGEEAIVDVEVDKDSKSIKIKGSLDPIQIGPLSISGTKGGKAEVDIEMSASVQKIHIDGDIKILDIESSVRLDAELLPHPSFSLDTTLDFTPHLHFKLHASTPPGSKVSLDSLKSLDFDVDALFEQDIINYIITQVNSSLIHAKHAADETIESAKAKLDKAKADWQNLIAGAEQELDKAQKAFDAALGKAVAAVEAEKAKIDHTIETMVAAIKEAEKRLEEAINGAEAQLKNTREDAHKKIEQAKQGITDAKKKWDDIIDGHLRKVEETRADMRARFGYAEQAIKNAESEVESCRSAERQAIIDRDDAQNQFDYCHWWQKFDRLCYLGYCEGKLEFIRAGLGIAEAFLELCEAVTRLSEYITCEGLIKFYEDAVEEARRGGQSALDLANNTLQLANDTADTLIKAANDALELVKHASKEATDVITSKKALEIYKATPDATLKALEDAVIAVVNGAEAVALGVARTALEAARAATGALDAAKAMLDAAKKAEQGVLDAADWLFKMGGNILNLTKAELKGDLADIVSKNGSLSLRIVGKFAEIPIDVTFDFRPGAGEDFIKTLWDHLIDEVDKGIIDIWGRG